MFKVRSRNDRNQRESFPSLRGLLAGLVRSMGKRRVRATLMIKLAGLVAVIAVLFFSYSKQQTVVGPSDSVVVSAASVTTTSQPIEMVPATTTTLVSMRKVPQSTTTVVEPWLTMPTTTTKVVLASYVPRTELEAMLCDPKWQWQCEDAIAIAQCESNMNPNAVSKPNRDGTRDRGLMQINTVWEQAWPPEVWARILEPEVNIAMAHHAYVAGNNSWQYWTCKRVLR